MKNKRPIILGALGVLVIAYIISILPNLRHRSEWKQTVKALQSLSRDRIDTAVQSFARDRKANNSVVPTAVPLRELVSDGYLGAEDIRGLEARDVTVSLTVDETTPSAIWIRVRAADHDTALMADGSILQLPR
jgi:type II secretory pathway component PulM